MLAWLALVVGVVVKGRRDEARPADAIIVLGAAQYEGRPSPVLRARLDHAIDLWTQGLAPRVVVTGGRGVGDTTSEAAVGRRYLLQHGVPDSAIMMEDRGLTTRQSMRRTADMLLADAPMRVILVSDPFHMLRLSILGKHLGLHPYTSPTRTSPISASASRQWKYVLAESLKVPFTLLLETTDDTS